MNYGERISKLREEKNITQKELASKLYVTDKTISSWESNRTEPSLEMIIRLSEVLECSATYLLYGNNLKENIEMEIKVKLSKEEYDNLNEIMKLRGKFLVESNQKDTYYQPVYLNDDMNKWLRIRLSGNKKILTYKKLGNKMYCEEYEVEIDNSNNLEKIFDSIGLKKITVISKNRMIYSYLDKYEVSLDNVDGLGYFIEIEVKDTIKDYMEEYDELLKNSKKLGLNLNNIVKERYPQLMINNWEKNNE